MKKLIAYGDDLFKRTLKRLKKEAALLKIFDKIIIYNENDLPDYIKASPLMCKRGGYWLWKPYIILDAINKSNIGDIIVYVDAGCTLNNSVEWNTYFDLLNQKNKNMLVMQYRNNFNYGWSTYVKDADVTLRRWMKKTCIDFFKDFFKDEDLLNNPILWAGSIMVKKTQEPIKVLDDWFKIMLFNPLIVFDPLVEEENDQYIDYIEHRHDQAILSALVYYNQQLYNNIILYKETSESRTDEAAIGATRIRFLESNFTIRKRMFKNKVKKIINLK